MFIELTEVGKGHAFINADKIVSVRPHDDGGTIIEFDDAIKIFVESYTEVKTIIRYT